MDISDEYQAQFMQRAIALSQENVRSGKGGPFGAVIVQNGQIIAEGTNQVTATNDPTAHAEIVAIRAACAKVGQFQLDNCTMYTSCEPCPMCLGAIYWTRPAIVYFANTKTDAAAIDFDDLFIYDEISKPLGQRAIKFVHMPDEGAKAVFDEWRDKHDKAPY